MHDGFARHVAGAVTASQFLGLSERLGRFPLISWCVESRFGGVQALGKNGEKKGWKIETYKNPSTQTIVYEQNSDIIYTTDGIPKDGYVFSYGPTTL